MPVKRTCALACAMIFVLSAPPWAGSEPPSGAPPHWLEVPELEAVEDVPLSYDFSGNVSDPDTPTGDLCITSESHYVTGVDGLNVTFEFPNGVLEASVPLNLTDGTSVNGTRVNFTVAPVNDPPRWLPADLPDAEQDVFYSHNLTAVDVDDAPGELSYSDDAPFLQISPTGELAFVPRNEHVGTWWFNVTVWDPGGLSDTMRLRLRVNGTPPDPWVPFPVPPFEAYEDRPFTVDLMEYTNPPVEGFYSFYDDTDRFDVHLTSGVVFWDSPTHEDVGDIFFIVTIVDAEGHHSPREFRVIVHNTPDAPLLGALPSQALTQGVRFILDVPVVDEDLLTEGVEESLEFSGSPAELFGIDRRTGRIDLTPTNRQVGTWKETLTVTDSTGLQDSVDVVFHVHNANDPPILLHVPDQELTEDVLFVYQLEAYDPDMDPRLSNASLPVDPAEVLTFSSGREGVEVNATTGTVTFVPTDEDARVGEFLVVLRVEDAHGGRDEAHVHFTVHDVPDNPSVRIVTPPEGHDMMADVTHRLVAEARTEDGEPWGVEYRWYIDGEYHGEGTMQFWDPRGEGPRTIEVEVLGDDGSSVTDSVDVTVFPRPDGDDDGLSPATGAMLCAAALVVIVVMIVVVVVVLTGASGGLWGSPPPPWHRRRW